MKSVLSVEVSCFASYKVPKNPQPVNLLTWLTSTKYRAKVDAIRAMGDKKERDRIKATLPAITPSGLFTRREDTALLPGRHSGFICLDIDHNKHNSTITNYAHLKTQLCRIPNVAYCGLSVSGTGFFVLISIAHPNQHPAQFRALQLIFKQRYKIDVDDTPDVSRLRGYSYDPAAYFNHAARPFGGIYTPAPQKPTYRNNRDYSQTAGSSSSVETTRSNVEDVLTQLRGRSADMTGDNRQWFEIGCSLANEFGEHGREYFHDVSQYYPGYQSGETDRKFDYALTKRYRYSIGTFFKYAQLAGFVPTRAIRSESAQNGTPPAQQKAANKDSTVRSELLSQYPTDWDTISNQTPPTLTISPRRDEFARLLNVAPADLPLYQLTRS